MTRSLLLTSAFLALTLLASALAYAEDYKPSPNFTPTRGLSG
jgi:hypothetical protein